MPIWKVLMSLSCDVGSYKINILNKNEKISYVVVYNFTGKYCEVSNSILSFINNFVMPSGWVDCPIMIIDGSIWPMSWHIHTNRANEDCTSSMAQHS